MVRTGSTLPTHNQERVDAWVRSKLQEFEVNFIDRLRQARAEAQAKHAAAVHQVILIDQPTPPPPAHYIIVSNSDPKKRYNVVLYPTRGECECMGYKYRRNCSHIEEARALHESGIGGIYDE